MLDIFTLKKKQISPIGFPVKIISFFGGPLVFFTFYSGYFHKENGCVVELIYKD